MKHTALLKITSLLSILLLTLHLTHDIVLRLSKAEPSNFYAVFYFVILLCGPLMLAERRLGHVLMFIAGLIATGMPAFHLRGARYAELAASSGGFFFVWTLFALGVTGGLSMILSVQGLWSLRQGRTAHGIGAQA
jgi:hypothetical protein